MLFDFAGMASENVYKLLVSTIVPRPIAWVTTKDIDGTINAAPVSFFNAVSGNPPVLVIGIGGRAPGDVKDTGGNIRRTGEFVINLVSHGLAEHMNITAIDFSKEVNELREAALTIAPSALVQPPRIQLSVVSRQLSEDSACLLHRRCGQYIAPRAATGQRLSTRPWRTHTYQS